MEELIIAVDFDGTCVTHEYPRIGRTLGGAVETLTELTKFGHKLILYTMRDGYELKHAVEWFENNKIPLYAVQKNPTQHEWTQSNKCYAHIYIDDAALGCPLIYSKYVSDRPFVNWKKVHELLTEKGVFYKN